MWNSLSRDCPASGDSQKMDTVASTFCHNNWCAIKIAHQSTAMVYTCTWKQIVFKYVKETYHMIRLSIFSQLSIIQYMGLCVFSLLISLVVIKRIYTLSYYHHQIGSIIHCLGLGHETMVCAVCIYILIPFLCADDIRFWGYLGVQYVIVTCISIRIKYPHIIFVLFGSYISV